jgi:hypothetical protein
VIRRRLFVRSNANKNNTGSAVNASSPSVLG